jgi:hypothetical protein
VNGYRAETNGEGESSLSGAPRDEEEAKKNSTTRETAHATSAL